MSETNDQEYGIAAITASEAIPAPELPYQPPRPRRYQPAIGLIGCGGITSYHLAEYKKMGLRVTALCDLAEERARKRRDEYYPEAAVYTGYRELLRRDEIEVVDIATHPAERVAIIREALQAGKHVLSQKPFVLDLDAGRELADLADRAGRRLAVNQNGRWAPHFSYIRHAIQAGCIGEPLSITQTVHWDHSWIKGTEFEKIKHVILYDFAIHWFDIVSCFMGGRTARRVFASVTRGAGQKVQPPLLAHAAADFEGAQATWSFNAASGFGPLDQTLIVGTKGSLHSTGKDLTAQQVTLFTTAGHAQAKLEGTWFENGFQGTMGELLAAIEENREPAHSARNNLTSLALCFAAVASAETGVPQVPGEARRMAEG
ncbi:MAG: Gfo/Idh/MocA family protein [bacterium]